jgi:uncharacterized protein (TIGR02117 family)
MTKKVLASFKTTLKNTLRFFELFFAFLFIYLIISILGGVISTGQLKKKGDLYIYVQSNGIHTDVCLPVKTGQIDWNKFIPKSHFPNNEHFEFITIGWGDRGFFLDAKNWSDLTFSTAFNAAFLPTPTLMHIKYGKEPKITDQRKRVYLNKRDYYQLIRFVKKSFVRKDNKLKLITGQGYTNSDNFYEAHNTYHMFRTCNIWTNDALKVAGVKTGVYALFPGGILSHLD